MFILLQPLNTYETIVKYLNVAYPGMLLGSNAVAPSGRFPARQTCVIRLHKTWFIYYSEETEEHLSKIKASKLLV